MLLYDMVGPEDLGSAVRLQATGLNFGMLLGPHVGAALLFTVGPAAGMFINVALYVPFIVYLWMMPFTGHTHRAGVPRLRLGLRATSGVLAEIPRYPSILLVFVLQGAVGLFIGTALLPLLPEFGDLLVATGSGFGYCALIAAMSIGAVAAGLGVEALGRVRASVTLTAVAVILLGSSLIVFALSRSLVLSVLVLAGAGSLLAATTAQTVVQLEAPEDRRGRFLGAFSMTSQGLRLSSGVLVGLFTGLVGPAGAIGIDAVAVALVLLVVVLARRDARGPVIAVEDDEPVADEVTS